MLVVVLLCCCAAATVSTLPSPPPLQPPSVGKQDDACYTNTNSSTNVGMVLPSPTQGGAMATRVADK
jgi:hypothetical protein